MKNKKLFFAIIAFLIVLVIVFIIIMIIRKNFLDNSDVPLSLDNLSFKSGVDLKNINRYMETKEFSSYKKLLTNNSNLKINL